MALSLDIGANTRAAASQIKSLGEDLDDVVGKLDDVGKGGKGAGEDLERALSDAERAGSQLGDGVEAGASRASDAVTDLGQAASSALTGDFDGAVQGVLGSLAGLAGAAGVGGAVGSAVTDAIAGLVSMVVDKWGEYTEKMKEIRDETTSSLVEMGGAFDSAALKGRIEEIVNDTDRWAAVQKVAAASGVDANLILAGMAGNTAAAAESQRQLNAALEATPGNVSREFQDIQGSIDAVNEAFGVAAEKTSAVTNALALTGDASATAQGKYEALLRSLGQSPPQIPPIKLTVDDSAVRNYTPPRKVAVVEYKAAQTAWQ